MCTLKSNVCMYSRSACGVDWLTLLRHALQRGEMDWAFAKGFLRTILVAAQTSSLCSEDSDDSYESSSYKLITITIQPPTIYTRCSHGLHDVFSDFVRFCTPGAAARVKDVAVRVRGLAADVLLETLRDKSMDDDDEDGGLNLAAHGAVALLRLVHPRHVFTSPRVFVIGCLAGLADHQQIVL